MMLTLPKRVSQRSQMACEWGRIADWIARHDYQIPVYHRLCLAVWQWALQQSLADVDPRT
jgi:hypothetical protein